MRLRSWIVSVGPNPGRDSSHAHGPVTDTGPVRVVPVEEVKTDVLALITAMRSFNRGALSWSEYDRIFARIEAKYRD